MERVPKGQGCEDHIIYATSGTGWVGYESAVRTNPPVNGVTDNPHAVDDSSFSSACAMVKRECDFPFGNRLWVSLFRRVTSCSLWLSRESR